MEQIVISIDIEWAPDWMIDKAASLLIHNGVKSTWFVTHASPSIDKLRQMPELFELGIHPNCLSGSTHGNTEDEVLSHMKEVVPDAVSMRTHGLYQTTSFLMKAAHGYGIKMDASLLLPGAPDIVCHTLKWEDAELRRAPCFWEDDVEMSQVSPCWYLSSTKYNVSGLKIFSFHPIHIALNSPTMGLYEELKSQYPVEQWTPDLVKRNRWGGLGTVNLFMDLVNLLRDDGMFVRDLVNGDV